MPHNAMAFIPGKYKLTAYKMRGYTFPPIVLTRRMDSIMNDDMLEQQFFSELLRKNPYIGDKAELMDKTIDSFFQTEQRCYDYNSQFDKLLSHPWMGEVLRKWKENVGIILHQPFIHRVPAKITAGATTSCKTGNTPLERFSVSEITPELLAYVSNKPELGMPLGIPAQRNGSVSHQVPKTFKINRLIALEPAENILLQSEIGAQMSALFSYQGIHIREAQEVHKAYAWFGSITGDFTTDDLTSASNLIYCAIARFLLPTSWRDVCDAARSQHITINGESRELQTYATNGNGFCFELETILFYAMLQTAHEKVHGTWSEDCRTYGDDLIYPASITDTVRRICRGVGFITNLEKSFSTGLFRESCGGDFINGVNVRPIHLKNRLGTSYEKIVHLNQIYAKFGRRMPKYIRMYYFSILRSIPVADRYYGPGQASGAIHFPLFWSEKPNKWGVTKYREWRLKAVDFTSFGHLIPGINPDVAIRIISGGYAKGHGGFRLKENYHSQGADRDTMLALRLRPKDDINYDIKYNLIPASGTQFIESRESSVFFQCSQAADPLAVLEMLRLKGNPLMQHDYYRKVMRPRAATRVILERTLIDVLKKVIDHKQNIYARQSCDIDLDNI